MGKLIFIFFILAFDIISGYSQKLSPGRYWISFSDKTGNNFSISSPEKFLSQKSIQRRTAQGIPVKIEDLPVTKSYVDSLTRLGITVLGTSKWFNAAIVESNDTLLLSSLNSLSFIKGFNYFSPLRLSKNSIPEIATNVDIPVLPSLLQSSYGTAYKQIDILRGNSLHDRGYKGENMIIAVFDGGFYHVDSFSAFDSLWQNNRIITWHDFARPAKPDFFGSDSHGMSVLSTMGANIPGEIVGTAPNASYILIRSEVSGSENLIEEAWWVLAAEFADSCGADVINSSLGYSTFDDSLMNYSISDLDGKTSISTLAAEKAFSKGMVVVVSAGNEGANPWRKISSPSDGEHVLAVGAIDTFQNLAAFSSVGPSADNRVKPDVVAVGVKAAIFTSAGITSTGNGTSFSSPQVAGLVACLWQAVPDKTNNEILTAVRRSSSRYYSPNGAYGYGIPDFFLALNQLKSLPQSISNNELILIPNPNSGIFEIRLLDPEEPVLKVNIYNPMGKCVAVINLPEIRTGYVRITEATKLQPGIYYIILYTPDKNYLAKLVKI